MTRTEMDEQSQQLSAYADLDSVRDLREAQHKGLRESKLPIDQARDDLIADIQRNPRNASWATPSPEASASGGAPASAGAGGASAGAAGASETMGGALGVPAPEKTAAPLDSAPGESSAAPAPKATPADPKTPKAPATTNPPAAPETSEPAPPVGTN
jgi:hypothetical protein